MKYDYKCVAVLSQTQLKGRMLSAENHDNDAKEIEGLINKHASEGWEFMSICNLPFGNVSQGFAIFRRQH